jgi:hypothetical protein
MIMILKDGAFSEIMNDCNRLDSGGIVIGLKGKK